MVSAERRIASGLIVVILLAFGCSHNPTYAELAKVYCVGLKRSEIGATLGSPARANVRPSDGWHLDKDSAYQTGIAASAFEEKNGVRVQTCEVRETIRGWMGLWWDYLYYGADDRLLGFRRRLVD